MSEVGIELAQELFSYVGFTEEDASRLAALGPILAPSFEGIVGRFYDVIREHPGALAVFDGEAQIRRQQRALEHWLESAFSGEYGEAWFAQRIRIGEVHVKQGLPQRYMFSAMNLVRQGLHEAVPARREELGDMPVEDANLSIDRLLDVELAIMLQTWHSSQTRRLRVAERLGTLGQIAASIGHELRNPLAVVQTSVHILERRAELDERGRKHLERIREQTKLCSSIISSLLELARDRPIERATVDLDALVAEIFESLEHSESITLSYEPADGLARPVADAAQLRQLLVNLVQNALQVLGAEPGGRVIVTATARDEDLLLAVHDSGPGLPKELEERIFEPLVTGREGGVGLGLALCRRIAEKHGGQISAGPSPHGGACFIVELPGALRP